MRLIASILIIALSGCANTPWRADYTRNDMSQYDADKASCQAYARKSGDEAEPAFSDVKIYFIQKFMLSCMREKGYEPVGISPNAYKQNL